MAKLKSEIYEQEHIMDVNGESVTLHGSVNVSGSGTFKMTAALTTKQVPFDQEKREVVLEAYMSNIIEPLLERAWERKIEIDDIGKDPNQKDLFGDEDEDEDGEE